MLLQSLPLTGKLVREPVREIRLKEITAAVIPTTFLAAKLGAGIALPPGTVTTGIYLFAAPGATLVSAGDAEHPVVQGSRGSWAETDRSRHQPEVLLLFFRQFWWLLFRDILTKQEEIWRGTTTWRGTTWQRVCDSDAGNKRQSPLMEKSMVVVRFTSFCGLCPGLFSSCFIPGFPSLATKMVNLL